MPKSYIYKDEDEMRFNADVARATLTVRLLSAEILNIVKDEISKQHVAAAMRGERVSVTISPTKMRKLAKERLGVRTRKPRLIGATASTDDDES